MLPVRANDQGLHVRMEDTFALERAMDFAVCSRDDAVVVLPDRVRIEPRLV